MSLYRDQEQLAAANSAAAQTAVGRRAASGRSDRYRNVRLGECFRTLMNLDEFVTRE